MQNFQDSYATLNKEQQEAVDALQGPVMVIAGPGTGKTQILALRIANILRKKLAPPGKILALTFSESGVTAMRKRLIAVAGTAGYYVSVHTFHGFCQNIIERYSEDFPTISSSGNMSEVEQVQLGQKILDECPFNLVRPFGDPGYYLRPIFAEIANLKKEGIGPEFFLEKVLAQEKELLERTDLYHGKGAHKGKMKAAYRDEQEAIEKNKELAIFYATYQEALRNQRRYDYDDMILLVMRKLMQDEAFQSRIGANYDFILVDEHQDTNSAQNKVVELLLAEKEIPNIFVVGDEKQAIFRFQGATIENFLYFTHRFPSAHLVTLKENYRSGQEILDSTHALIARRKKNIQNVFPQISEALNAASKGHISARPAVWEFQTSQAEHYFIAKSIQKFLAEGVEPRGIAVIFRENREAADIKDVLSHFDIPHVFEGASSMFDDPLVQSTLRVFRYCADVGNEKALMEALGIRAFGIPVLDRWKLMALRTERMRREKGTLVHAADIMCSPGKYREVQWENPEALKKTYAFLSRIASMASEHTLPVIYEETLKGIGVVSLLKEAGDDPALLAGVRKLSEEVKKFAQERARRKESATLANFLEYLDLFQTHGIRLSASISHANKQAVRLMTAHRAKGLEFDYVFIPHALHSFWGSRRKRSLFHLPSFASFDNGEEDMLDDDRRLFFVAMTRARKSVVISYPMLSDQGKELVPSIFVNELLEKDDKGNVYAEKFSGLAFDEEANNIEVVLAQRGESSLPLQEQQDFVKDLFVRRGLAVTHLNNYLECPWKYFYINLLKMPSAETLSQIYGTAVHSALQQFFEKAKSGKVPGKFELLEMLSKTLDKQILTDAERTQLAKQGNMMLSSYYDFYKSSWNWNTKSELAFAFPLSETIRLTGKIDKIEMQRDGSVVVVDYKTGNPKTRGQIEKEESGNLKRQLAFYTFFLTHYQQEKYRVKSVELDFVQPDAKGKFHKEAFVVTPEECDALEQDIRRVAEEIMTLAFWGKRCENEKCEWCALRFA